VTHVAPKVAVTYGGMCGPGCARPITVVIRRVGKDMLRDMYLLTFFRLSQTFPSINNYSFLFRVSAASTDENVQMKKNNVKQ
jgi:hypothetical protein